MLFLIIAQHSLISSKMFSITITIGVEFANFVSYHLACYPNPNPNPNSNFNPKPYPNPNLNPNSNPNSNSNSNPKLGRLFHKVCELLFSITTGIYFLNVDGIVQKYCQKCCQNPPKSSLPLVIFTKYGLNVPT